MLPAIINLVCELNMLLMRQPGAMKLEHRNERIDSAIERIQKLNDEKLKECYNQQQPATSYNATFSIESASSELITILTDCLKYLNKKNVESRKILENCQDILIQAAYHQDQREEDILEQLKTVSNKACVLVVDTNLAFILSFRNGCLLEERQDDSSKYSLDIDNPKINENTEIKENTEILDSNSPSPAVFQFNHHEPDSSIIKY